MNGYRKREIRPRPITAGTINGGNRAAARPAITPNPRTKRPKSTKTTKYNPNAFHLKPLVRFHERPTPAVPPGSGSRTAAFTAPARPHAPAVPRIMMRMDARPHQMPRAEPGRILRPVLSRAKYHAEPITRSQPR